MTAPCLLGIDVGTSGTKVIAVTTDGTVLAQSSCSHRLSVPRPGWVEQDPDDWWAATQAAVRTVVARIPGGPQQVAAIGLAGHMSSVVGIDAAGRPVRPCMLLSDTRSADEAAQLDERFGRRIQRLCGARPSAAAVAPRMLWLQRHEPEAYRRTEAFVFAKDYVRLRLTGELASEATDAGNTMLLGLASGRWDEQLIQDAGLDVAKLPQLVPTSAVAGEVTAEAAASTGLRAGTPVVAGAADMAATAVGAGAVEPGVVGITIGTAAPVITSFQAMPLGARGQVTFHVHPMPGWLYSIGSIFSGGLSLSWLADVTGGHGGDDRAADYERLSAEAAAVPRGSDGVIFLPFLVGSGSPDFDGAMRGTFLGLSLRTNRGALVRAVMEGVAYNARECIDVFRRLGAPVERIHLGGGGSASSTWQQIFAGVLGTPVHPVVVRDMAALGSAALAGVGIGAFADVRAAARTLVTFEEPVGTGGDEAVETYERGYEAYRRVRLGVRPLYRQWSDQRVSAARRGGGGDYDRSD